jgi:hypothetical protein
VRPTYSHAALATLAQAGIISYLASQNVDGLHLRAGHPREGLAELHGNVFAEACARPGCGTEWVRDVEVGSVGRRPTPRRCAACGRGRLRDSVLDWEQALPAAELAAAERAAESARLTLCLGTSLQIVPACDLPLRTVGAGGDVAIVNLQATPKDGRAALVIRGRCDAVMRRVMARLARAGCEGVPAQLPPYVRTDVVIAAAALSGASPSGVKRARGGDRADGGGRAAAAAPPRPARRATLSVGLASPAGEGPAFPVSAMVAGLEVWVGEEEEAGGEEGPSALATTATPDADLGRPPWVARLPVTLERGGGGCGGGEDEGEGRPTPRCLHVTVRLRLSPAADPGTVAPVVSLRLPAVPGASVRQEVSFVSQTVCWGPH